MSTSSVYPVAVIGSGAVATDLMRRIDDGDGRLRLLGTAGTIEALLAVPEFDDVRLVFDATSASAHHANCEALAPSGVRTINLTAASVGPQCVPVVNLDEHLDAPNLGVATGGGQATVPIVSAVSQCGIVSYAEVVSAVSTRAAGPDARSTIDDFIESTSAALQSVGGALRAKAVLILNPADPPVVMRNTVYCLVDGDGDHAEIERAIASMVDRVNAHVPGYRLRQRVQFETFSADRPLHIPETGRFTGTRVTTLLEVASTAHHLPAYAGDVEIVTSMALVAAERIAVHSETVGALR